MAFSTNDMQRKTGVKRHRLHTWILTGLFIPSASSKVGGGHGIGSEYSREDLYRIALLRKLIENGIHGATAANASNATTINFKGIHDLHQAEKTKGHPGLILCLARRFKNGEEASSKIWIDVPGYQIKSGLTLHERIVKMFNEWHYDDIFLINLSKIIDEVDSR